jgi:brefeldin A-inhibited guanine nucleotide-exchange protein
VIYEALHLACQPHKVTPQTMSTAVDCLGKLISYQYFIDPPRPVSPPDSIVPAMRADAPTQPLMHRVVDTITKAFEGDATDVRVQLQIIKALLTTVLNDGDDRTMVHGPALLKCVRGVYNISLLGRAEGGIQSMAQRMLMQMVDTIFNRVSVRPRASSTITLDKDVVVATENEVRPEDPQQITLYLQWFWFC